MAPNGYNLKKPHKQIRVLSSDELSEIISVGVYASSYFTKKRTAVLQLLPNGEFVTEHFSISKAAASVGVTPHAIQVGLDEKSTLIKGFVWRRKGGDLTYIPPITQQSHNRKMVDQFTLDGIFVKRYDCLLHAANSINRSVTNIIAVCKGKVQHSGNFVWRYAGDLFEKNSFIEYEIEGFGKKVSKYSMSGELLEIFPRIKDAVRATPDALAPGIVHSCRGNYFSHCGFVWRYEGDSFNKFTKELRSGRAVIRTTKDCSASEIFARVKDAVNATNNASASGIIQACKRADGSHAGFKWKYADR